MSKEDLEREWDLIFVAHSMGAITANEMCVTIRLRNRRSSTGGGLQHSRHQDTLFTISRP